MTTYYVRKTGSDAAAGTSPAAAWLTIDKAANTVAAGDTVYVGAGVYRELVTIDTSGSSGSAIKWYADVTGENTGDAGLVIISAYADETSVATRVCCLDLNDGKTFNEFYGFVMTGGTSAAVYDDTATNNNYEGVLFEDCVIVSGHTYTDYAVNVDYNAGTTPTGAGLTFRRCLTNGGHRLIWNGNETAQQNLKVVFDGCFFGPDSYASSSAAALWWDRNVAGTYGSGGVTLNNCALYVAYGVNVDHGTSTTYPIAAYNCLFNRCMSAMQKSTSDDGALTGDYNWFWSCGTEYSNVTAGANDKDDLDLGPGLLGGLHDLPFLRYFGWSPFRPWEPIRLQDDTYVCNLIGGASASYAPAFDLYNENRPMHGTADDIGAVEGRARAEKETSTVRTGSNAVRFEGAGYHDILLPVDASSTTVSVYGRYDASYTGTLPQLKVFNIPGVADQSDTMTGGSGAWEELTATFTPTAAGVCRVRLVSNDTSAGGQSFFDDLTVS